MANNKVKQNIIFMNEDELIEAREKYALTDYTLVSGYPYLLLADGGGQIFSTWKSSKTVMEWVLKAALWEDYKEIWAPTRIPKVDSRVFSFDPIFGDLLVDGESTTIINYDEYIKIYCKEYDIPYTEYQNILKLVRNWEKIEESAPQSHKNLHMIIRDRILHA